MQLRTVSIISGKSSTLTHFKTVTLVQTFNENTIFLHLSSSTLLGFAFPIFLLIMGTVEGDKYSTFFMSNWTVSLLLIAYRSW